MEITTADVVERPTSSAPAPVEKPSWQPTAVMIIPNTKALITPVITSESTSALRVLRKYPTAENPPPVTPKKHPPKTPIKSAQIARQGTITAMAMNLGATRNASGSSAI